MLLVYWIHKVSRAAGDRMRLDRRIPLLVSTFEYKRGEGKCSTVSFLNLSLSPSLPPKSGWPGIKGYPAREVSLSSFPPSIGGLASEIAVFIANLALELLELST